MAKKKQKKSAKERLIARHSTKVKNLERKIQRLSDAHAEEMRVLRVRHADEVELLNALTKIRRSK